MTDTGGWSVAKGQVDEVLAALAKAGGDSFGARREIIERLSFDLLHCPEFGGQLVARLCAIADPTPKDVSYRGMAVESACYRREGLGRSWQAAYWLDRDADAARQLLKRPLSALDR